jgi:hypothetical protein
VRNAVRLESLVGPDGIARVTEELGIRPVIGLEAIERQAIAMI